MGGLSGLSGLSGEPGVFGGAGDFSPLDIAGLQLWLDSLSLSTLWQDSAGTIPVSSVGDVIGKWDDLSGSGNHYTQGTTAQKPEYQTSNGAAARFDGADDRMVSTFTTIAGNPITVYCVYKPRVNIASFDGLYEIENALSVFLNNNASYRYVAFIVDNNFGSVPGIRVDNIVIGDTTKKQLGITYNGGGRSATGSYTARLNTADQALINSANVSGADTTLLGRDTAAAATFDGDIQSLVVYDNVLSSGSKNLLEAYLQNRYTI